MTPETLARYADSRLPRYTSYPTAPHFTDAVGPATYAGWLATLPAETVASLYVHVPFCRRMCWYCGCNTTVSRQDGPIADYVGALRREIEVVSGHIGRPLPVRHLR